MSKIKNIILDLGGVLLDLDMPRSFAQFKALGVDFDTFFKQTSSDSVPKPGAALVEGVEAKGVMNAYQMGNIDTDCFLSVIASSCSAEGVTELDVLNAWNSCLLTVPQFKLDRVLQLRSEGYNLYMLSNTNDAHWQYIERTSFPDGTDRYFDRVFLSHEMHLAKPDPSIFTTLLEEINATPDECLFIDDISANCDAAAALGLHTFKADVAVVQPDGTLQRPETEWFDAISL